jgi:uncharacterized membrane protein
MIPRLQNDHSELPRLALSLAKLSAVGFSLVLCVQLSGMQLAARSSYTLSNVLGAPGRNLLLLSLGAGILTPVLIGLSLYLRKGTLALETLEYWATVLAPLAVTFVVPGLFLHQVAEAKPLFYLVVLAAFGLVARALLAASLRAHSAGSSRRASQTPSRFYALQSRLFGRFPALHLRKTWALSLVLLLASGYASYFGHYTVARHRLIQTIDNDLGIVDNFMANVLHGSFRAPAEFGTLPRNYLSAHADYIALLFAPIYRLHPGAETLLWLQAGLAGLAVVPLFLLSIRLLGQRMAIWATIAYLLLSPLHAGLVYGFSWFPAFCLFSFTLYYAVVAERRWLLLFSLPALLASTEAGPPAVFALGVFLATSRRKPALGIGLCAAALLVFAFNTRLSLRAGGEQLPPIAAGLTTLLNNPVYFILDLARAAKLTSILHALSPLSLLPLLAWGSLSLLFPALLFTSASQNFWPASSALAPFQLLWIPGAILSLLFVLHRLRNTPNKRPLFVASVVAISITLASHSYDFGLLLRGDALANPNRSEQFKPSKAEDKRYADLQSVVRKIPASASVVATSYVLPYVSSRRDVFDARRPYGRPDYVFFSTRELVAAVKTALSATLSGHDYALVAHTEEFYVFRRAAETPETGAILRTLGLYTESPAKRQ